MVIDAIDGRRANNITTTLASSNIQAQDGWQGLKVDFINWVETA